MATKYAGQTALNKLMQLVKTALASKADKTNATTSAAGLMSAADKTKLDGIAAGATKITVDSALSTTSTNPVENRAVKGELDGKADKSALDDKLDKTGGTITGSLEINNGIHAGGAVQSDLLLSAPSVTVHNDTAEASVHINCSGDNAAGISSLGSDGKSHYSRFAVGTPTGDNDAATKAYVDGKIAAGGVTVDTELSGTSTNPVQNKVIKSALDAKAEKTALDGKLDVTGGTILGDLKVKTNAAGTGNIDVEGEIRVKSGTARLRDVYATNTVHSDLMVEAPLLNLRAPLAEKSVQVKQDGDTAVKMECFDGTLSKGYARLEIGTPTGDNDATTKSYVDTKVSGLQTADQVQAAISSAVAGVYTPKGSIAFASLPTAAAGNKGWVYNVSDAFTTTAAFVEGAGHSYGAGTNVVCVDVGSGSYKWDVLAGTIDLTELSAAEVQTLWDSI